MAAKDVRDRIRSGEPVKKAEYVLNQGDKKKEKLIYWTED